MANVKKTLIATTVAVATLAAPATAFADDGNNIQPDVNGAIEQAQNAVSQTQDTVAQATQATSQTATTPDNTITATTTPAQSDPVSDGQAKVDEAQANDNQA